MDMNTVIYILALIALVIGIALALFGRAIWGSLLSMMGGMIGWMIGFAVGVIIFGFDNLMAIILVIICGFIGRLIMGEIFRYLVEAALALLTAILTAGIFWYIYQDQFLIAIIIFAVVFILAYVFIEKVVVVVTAFIGSIIAGVGLFFLLGNAGYAVMGALALLVTGILIQFFLLDDSDNFRY